MACGRRWLPPAMRMVSTPDSARFWSTTACWAAKSRETPESSAL